MIRTEEGFLKRSGSGYIHYIYIKDHLGNNRAVVRSDGWGGWNQYQEMSYYPFGMPHYFSDYSAELQPFKFGDKELDEMHGLKWYDQQARFFGSVIPVTTTPDPKAELFYNTSPYVQWNNSPTRFIDPDGKVVIPLIPLAVYAAMGATTGYVVGKTDWNQMGKDLVKIGENVGKAIGNTVDKATATSKEVWNHHNNKQKAGKEKLDKNQANVQQTVVTGGHNPQDPGGEFKNNNDDPNKGFKVVAGATVAGISLEEGLKYVNLEDNSQQQQPQQHEQQQQDSSTWERIKNFLNW
jgi:RHS repeat-associated protein